MGGKKSGRRYRQNSVQTQVADGYVIPDEDGAQPQTPTEARPGSPEKIEILAERSAKGEPLFGDGDTDVFREGLELIGCRGDEHLARRGEIRSNSGRKKNGS